MKKFLFLLLIPSLTGFSLQDEQPSFRGGNAALNNFLSQNLIYPEYSRQNCLSGKVQVTFTLDKAGKVLNPRIHSGFGTDLDEEALRIVKLTSGKWNVPASYDAATPLILPVTFENPQGNYRCNTMSAEEKNRAITAYQSRRSLELAVTNYYRNKKAGKADTAREGQIEALKTQLGINDEYIVNLLRQAQRKIKQKDLKSACADLNYIKNIGSNRADKLLAQYCK